MTWVKDWLEIKMAWFEIKIKRVVNWLIMKMKWAGNKVDMTGNNHEMG